MVRQAVIRNNIHYAVINDNQLKFVQSLGVTFWPTVVVFSPDSRILFKSTGEGSESEICALLQQSLTECATQIERENRLETDWINLLNSSKLTLQFERDK